MKVIRKVNGIPTKEYYTWKGMKARCYAPCNKNMGNYQTYKIEVCERWLNSFDNFIEDMGLAPSKKHSIDRIDTKKDYSKDNCRWATSKQQAGNRGNFNITFSFKGETMILKDWAEKLGIKYTTLYQRLYRSNLPFEIAIAYKQISNK